ncbi:MAG: hypothetical protein IKQ37_09330 [Bacteroidaceae bacterium]|nr:hypothetical protein [Bacteroidaceae bacterium]
MRKYYSLAALALVASLCLPMDAQSLKLKGIGHNNRYDDGEQMTSTYLGWNAELKKSIFIVDNGIYAMNYDGTTLGTPFKEPPVVASEIKGNNEKEIWADNFNMMYGNSGAAYINGKLVTVMSRDEQSTTDEELFAVRVWDATTGDLLSTEIKPKSATLESAGMSYNPKDGKVYGLFYMTGQSLPDYITSDPDYFEDQDADMTDGDAGYCLCTIDLSTMKVTPITPGLYYYNFVTFAINSEGRAFAMTSGGANGYIDEEGKMRNMDGELTGAQLWEFDLTTGLLKTVAVEKFDTDGEPYTDQEPLVPATGYCSQYRRQAACFAGSNPNKMYWVGYFNSGKGVNSWGSWSSLPDKEWRTNGKYDTALYEIDVNTGEATRLSKITNRWIFSALWIDGDDPSDNAEVDPFSGDDTQPTDGNYIALQHAENGSIWQQVEIGKQYTYFLQPAEGWKLHSVTFNDYELTIVDNTVTTPAVGAALNRLIVTFEEMDPTMIQEIAPTKQPKVLGTNGGLHISNATAGDILTVYDINGNLVRQQKLNATEADITLNSNALYIVKVGAKVVKVRL